MDTSLFGRHFSESYFRLPFVTLPAEEFATWGEFWERVDMWNDKPTANGCEDYQRGRRYARSAIEAIRQERATSRCLEITIERMLEGAFRRRGPKGKLCCQLSSAEQAFLQEVCRVVSKPWRAAADLTRSVTGSGWREPSPAAGRVTGSQPISGNISLPNEDLTLVTPPTSAPAGFSFG